MRPISPANRREIAKDPYYKQCAINNHLCSGRVTIEHAFLYNGKQIDEMWNFVPLCWGHHLGDHLDKRLNEYFALRHADLDDLERRYPKKPWRQIYKYLLDQYGHIQ